MNLSLQNRVQFSFIMANFVVGALGITLFHFLDTLNKEVDSYTKETKEISSLTDVVRTSSVDLLRRAHKLQSLKKVPKKLVEETLIPLSDFTNQLQRMDGFYEDTEIKVSIHKMIGYLDSFKVILKSGNFDRAARENSGLMVMAEKILESFSVFQDQQNLDNDKKDKKLKKIINDTKKYMLYTLIITFVGTMLLQLVIPGKIALPFKKINDAIRELQDCNFDVSIYYDQSDEIGEIASEMNKMIANFKKFEELRANRILLEGRKFDALANVIHRPVLVSNAKGELIYMNSVLYSLLQVQSDEVIRKNMKDTKVPHSIIETYELAIKRRSKIENAVINIPKVKSEEKDEVTANGEELAYSGYANVIPIRGKESSLDYYLMVLSETVFE